MPLMISRIGHARGRPVLFAAGRWGSITRQFLIGHVGLVSVRLADMLHSSGLGPHGVSGVGLSNPPGITPIPATQPLSKRPLSDYLGLSPCYPSGTDQCTHFERLWHLGRILCLPLRLSKRIGTWTGLNQR